MALGSDFSGVSDLDWALSTVSGRTALAQAILRRLRTRPGELITDTTYGFCVRDQIGANPNITAVSQGVLDQVVAEEEVQDADVDVTYSNGTLTVKIYVVDSEGPFDLTLTATELTTEALINNSLFWSETL